ncbi:hypothetical protein LO772_09080 [Yinghuangia sp. ASG 101]|uniref:hypothetical protein n=1 Tax=Yinghuangia sp. ASG 101 TaxID=2896848 RepID=UPI001E4035C3|nr:hypothetical protein [Yinghuangia sp. ASG 101]UGQ13731.1 hypothetical protein LO772_09080 [Yinghuangia sp. ASG 101]
MTGPGAWTREHVDREIARLEAERDSIAAGLMALEEHPGRRLLEGAVLDGRTRERWDACRADIGRLWDLHAAYGGVLDEARAVRGRRLRPTRAELDELARLLTTASIRVPGRDVSIIRRELVGPDASLRAVTFDELVAEMNTVWQRATRVVAAVDDVWSALLPRLDRVEAAIAETDALLDRLGAAAPPAEAGIVAEVRRRLGDARARVAADPLRFAADKGGSVVAGVDVDALENDLHDVRDRLRHLRQLQERYEERLGRVTADVDALAADEAEGRRRRAHVVTRIAGPVPEIPALVGPLRAGVDQVAALRAREAWSELSSHLGALERDTTASAERLRTARDDLDALMARRAELRGLLQAYRAMAGGRGRGEDEALEELHHRAYTVLWRAPCDLDVAAGLVADYQHAVTTPGFANRRPGTREATASGRADRPGTHHHTVRPAPRGIHHEDRAARPRGEGENHDTV